MSDCIFCKIVSGDIKADVVFRSETAVAFRDLHPQAPVHVLVVPSAHIAQLNQVKPGDGALMGELVLAANEIAGKLGISDGYRLVVNNGALAGQSVWHLHLHLLGGRMFGWPPG